VVKHLLDKNVKIKALLRPTTDSERLKNLGIEICLGDLTQPETIPDNEKTKHRGRIFL
jgi:uncharacterized protein YbjT (DUF2867 family)